MVRLISKTTISIGQNNIRQNNKEQQNTRQNNIKQTFMVLNDFWSNTTFGGQKTILIFYTTLYVRQTIDLLFSN